jgi:hypothetical protein
MGWLKPKEEARAVAEAAEKSKIIGARAILLSKISNIFG